MTPEQRQALARRAVACRDWRWMSGQPIIDPHGVRGYVVDIVPLPEPGAWVANRAGVSWMSAEEMGRCLPDLTDTATLGCLLVQVQQAWDDPQAHVAPLWGMKNNHVGWRVWFGHNLAMCFDGGTEAAALIAALEAAPVRAGGE